MPRRTAPRRRPAIWPPMAVSGRFFGRLPAGFGAAARGVWRRNPLHVSLLCQRVARDGHAGDGGRGLAVGKSPVGARTRPARGGGAGAGTGRSPASRSVRVHRPRMTVVQNGTACGSMQADPATRGPKAAAKNASVRRTEVTRDPSASVVRTEARRSHAETASPRLAGHRADGGSPPSGPACAPTPDPVGPHLPTGGLGSTGRIGPAARRVHRTVVDIRSIPS